MACRLGRFSKKPAQQYRWRLWAGKTRHFIRLCRIGASAAGGGRGPPPPGGFGHVMWCGIGQHYCSGWCDPVATQVN